MLQTGCVWGPAKRSAAKQRDSWLQRQAAQSLTERWGRAPAQRHAVSTRMNGLESVPPASSSQPGFPLGGWFQLRVTAGTSLMALCRLPVFCPGALAPGLLRGSLLKGCLLGASLGQNHLSAKVLPYPEVLKQQEPHHQHRESRASSNGEKQRRQKVAAQNSEREQTAPRQGLQSTQTALTGAWVCSPAAGSSSTGQYLLLTAWD